MKKQDRRKFLFTGLSISLAAVLAAMRFKKQSPVSEKKNMVKFLTQDGTLVEVDMDKLPTIKKAATKTDIQEWIKKN